MEMFMFVKFCLEAESPSNPTSAPTQSTSRPAPTTTKDHSYSAADICYRDPSSGSSKRLMKERLGKQTNEATVVKISCVEFKDYLVPQPLLCVMIPDLRSIMRVLREVKVLPLFLSLLDPLLRVLFS